MRLNDVNYSEQPEGDASIVKDLEDAAKKLSDMASAREERWLSTCMEKLMPERIFKMVHANPDRIGRWLRSNNISLNVREDGTKMLMRGLDVISILPPIDIAFKQ